MSGFNFAAPNALKPSGGFNILSSGIANTGASTASAPSGFAFQAATASTASAPSGFAFQAATASTTPAPSGFTFSSGTASSSNIAQPAATTSSPLTGLVLGQPQQPAASVASTSTPSVLGFPVATSSTVPLSTVSTSITSTTPAATLPSLPQSTLATSTVVSSAPSGGPTSMNFVQLEENINKWTIDLQEQEKLFMNQVQDVNEWDVLLNANSEKLTKLNESVEHVKQQQQQLDHELDFIVAQQKDLEECLAPLEKELANKTVTDPERERTFSLAENISSQLKQMSEDMKEIIEHLNETNKTQDVNDPMVQIGRILNAHMNSLQWIDKNCALIASSLGDVSELFESRRKELEKQQSYD